MSPNPFATHAELGLMQGHPPPEDKRVTRANGFWTPPYNRWSYQNMRTLWPSSPVGHGPASDMARDSDVDLSQLPVARRDGSMAEFETFLQETYTDALVVVHRGQIVSERYLNGMTPDTPHIMFSCTKSFVGLLALLAMDDGALTRDTPLTDLVPEATGGLRAATVGHLLDMTAAVTYDENYVDPHADIHDYLAILGLDRPAKHTAFTDYAVALPSDPTRVHGQVFHYQTPLTDVLNLAVSRATGQGFATRLAERIWRPLGLGEAYILLDPSGSPLAGGGLNATAPDMARVAAMLLAGGDGILPAHIIDTLCAGGGRAAFQNGPEAQESMSGGDWSYVAQWWVRHTPGSEAIIALGIGGQWIYVDRARDVAIVKQSSQPVPSDWYFHDYACNAMDAIVRHVAGEP